MEIIISTEPASSDALTLSAGIQTFNRNAVPNLESVEAEVGFHVLTKSEGIVIGGLRGSCYWNTLHIELLWLSDSARGGGIGQSILRAAETFAREQGVSLSLVETTSWQAKPFYERHGYVVIGKLEGRPEGHTTFYLSKSLQVGR